MGKQNKALRQRIAVHYNIEPLTEPETRDYIKHRLRVSGSVEEIFSPDAIYEIFSFSKGYPRLINTICDRALLTGYTLDFKQIGGKIAQKCANKLIIPSERDDTRNADMEGLEVKVDQKTTFTRDPRADQEELKANLNEKKFPLQKQPKSALRKITIIFAILIATGISLYFWLSPLGISYEYLINIWVIIIDVALNR